jgi:magnesium-transporting ATPase (P-type)
VVDPSTVGDSRQELEKDMDFVGLMSMENRLKKETKRELNLFNAAALRCVCFIMLCV